MLYTTPPTAADLSNLAERVLADIPAELLAYAKSIPIRIEDFPDEETEKEMDLESPFDILGLYMGTSLDRKSVTDIATEPDMIFLYRRPLLDYWCESGEDLGLLIRNVLIHEIGHHFGLSDEDMERLEEEA